MDKNLLLTQQSQHACHHPPPTCGRITCLFSHAYITPWLWRLQSVRSPAQGAQLNTQRGPVEWNFFPGIKQVGDGRIQPTSMVSIEIVIWMLFREAQNIIDLEWALNVILSWVRDKNDKRENFRRVYVIIQGRSLDPLSKRVILSTQPYARNYAPWWFWKYVHKWLSTVFPNLPLFGCGLDLLTHFWWEE